MNKVPVEVEIEERSDGEIIPRAIIWSDGRRFPISRVLYHGASSANEYEGIRYTVIIGSAEKIYLPSQSRVVCDGFDRRCRQ